MGRKTLPPYECARCGYETKGKTSMRRHLYDGKNTCKALKRDINLTDEIKEYILENHAYVESNPVTQPPPSVTQILNTHNNMINYIANMSTVTKLNELIAYNNAELTDFETVVEEKYSAKFAKFRKGKFKAIVHFDPNNVLAAVDEVTRAQQADMSDFVVRYDDDRYHVLLEDGNWEMYLQNNFVKYLIDMIVSYYLEAYEIYLIRKLELPGNAGLMEKPAIAASLEEYYKFISVFDVDPYVRGKVDRDLLQDDASDDEPTFHDVEAHRVVDKYNETYMRMKESASASFKRESVKLVVDIVKSNAKTNVKELNKCIFNAMKVDNEFKMKLIEA